MKLNSVWTHSKTLRLSWALSGVVILSGCAQVIVTQDQNGNNVSVKVKRPDISQVRQIPGAAAQSQSIEQMEETVRLRINKIRLEHGLKPLETHVTLHKVARDYSRQMAEKKFFNHYDPQGNGADDRVRATGTDYRMLGENLAMSQNAPDPVEMAVDGWMKSKGHRENLLRPEYTLTGLGIWKLGNSYWFTQLFLRPM